MPYDIGDSVPIAWNVQDAAGAPTNATGVTLTITLPDGSTSSPAVTNPPTTIGQYRYTYVPAIEGIYQWRAVMTGPNAAYQDTFDVRNAISPALLSLNDARTHLNISSTTFDDELREYLESATEIVESYVGPVIQRTYTRRVNGGRDVIILPHTQVTAVTSITAVWTGMSPVPLSYITIDTVAGDIRRKDGGWFPPGAYDITYTVGRTAVKANWTLAAKIILKHNWEIKLGNRPSPQGGDLVDVRLGTGFLVPFRAISLLSVPNSSQPMVY
jgi:hypothetical protein